MGRIEDKEGQLRNKMAEHAEGEIFRGFSRLRARQRQLETEAQDEPGAEVFLPELKEVEKTIDEKEKKARDGMKE